MLKKGSIILVEKVMEIRVLIFLLRNEDDILECMWIFFKC